MCMWKVKSEYVGEANFSILLILQSWNVVVYSIWRDFRVGFYLQGVGSAQALSWVSYKY